MYTANHSQPRVVVRGLLDIIANSVNQRANIRASGNRMPIQRMPRTRTENSTTTKQTPQPDKLQGRVCSHSCSLEKALQVQLHIQDGHVKADKDKGHRSVNSMNCEIASSFSVKLKRVTTKSFSVILWSSARTGLETVFLARQLRSCR